MSSAAGGRRVESVLPSENSIFMLKKQLRLTRKELKAFFGRRFRVCRGSMLTLRVSRNGSGTTKAAFVVASSLTRNAPARNTVRRRLGEIVSELYPQITPGLDLVFSYTLQKRTAPSFKVLKDDTIKTLSLCGAL